MTSSFAKGAAPLIAIAIASFFVFKTSATDLDSYSAYGKEMADGGGGSGRNKDGKWKFSITTMKYEWPTITKDTILDTIPEKP